MYTKAKHAAEKTKHVAITTAVKTKEVVSVHSGRLVKRLGKWGTVALVAALAFGVYKFLPERKAVSETIVVKSSGASAVVSVPGTVTPVSDVTLTFEGSGRVASVNVDVGDKVVAGSVLASLSQADLSAQIANARALRDGAAARLAELNAGTRMEDIAVSESQVSAAEAQASQASQTLSDTLNEAFQKVDDAVRVKSDVIFTNPRTNTPQLIVQADTSARLTVENERLALETVLNTLGTKTLTTPTSADVEATKALMIRVRNYLDQLSLIVNALTPNLAQSQASIDAYKLNIGTARASVSGFIGTVNAANTAFISAQTGIRTAQNQLALKKSGATKEQISAQEAQVRAANSNISNLQALSAKRVIYAPFTGTVTKVDVKRGEIVGAGVGISLISAARLQIESYIPEIYISKVSVNDKATLILDAYGSEAPFDAVVSSINPAATVRDGITSYKTTLKLLVDDSRTKPGMSGDVEIKPTKIDTLITIPSKSVINREGKNYVQIPAGERVLEREIIIGKMNDAGVAEVTSGLSDGDTILLAPIK